MSQEDLNSELECNFPIASSPPVTHSKHLVGSDVAVNVGVCATLGSIAVQLELINLRDDPNSPVNILQTTNGAGCAWQFSYLFETVNNRVWVFNQACGNNICRQWGYKNVFEGGGLAAKYWNPLVSDHYQDRGSEYFVANSPPKCGLPSDCGVVTHYENGQWVDDGRLHIGTGSYSTQKGELVDITYSYKLRSHDDQYWNSWWCEHAFYLNLKIAQLHNLRIYVVGVNGWREGPILPTPNYPIKNHESGQSTRFRPITHAIFVWNIAGRDIAIVIAPKLDRVNSNPVYAHLDISDVSVNWHTFIANYSPAQFRKGDERDYAARYFIGTLEQLSEIGYKIW